MKSSIEIANDLSLSIIDVLPSNVCLLDETGEIVAVNESWCRFAEDNPPVPKNYGIGINYLRLKADDTIPPGGDTSSADLFNFITGIKKVLNAESDEFSYDYPCHSPEQKRWFTGRVKRFIREGKAFLVISHENITSRVLAEQEFAHLVENIPVGVYALSTRPDGYMKFHYASPKLSNMIQISEKEILADHMNAFRDFHPDDIEGLRKINLDRINEPAYFEWTGRILLNGHVKWLHMASTPEPQSDGSTLWQGVVSDITESKLAEEKIKTLLSEKEILLHEVHHRVKNNMSTIIALLSLQGASLEDPIAIAALKETESRIRSMRLLYEKLFEADDFSNISAREYFSGLVDDIIDNFATKKTLHVEKNIDEFSLNVRDIQSLGIIINEIITNIMKYAFIGIEYGHITVNLKKYEDKIHLEITDDGIGIPESIDFENSKGFGLQLINLLTIQLNGEIKIFREKGTRILLVFPN